MMVGSSASQGCASAIRCELRRGGASAVVASHPAIRSRETSDAETTAASFREELDASILTARAGVARARRGGPTSAAFDQVYRADGLRVRVSTVRLWREPGEAWWRVNALCPHVNSGIGGEGQRTCDRASPLCAGAAHEVTS